MIYGQVHNIQERFCCFDGRVPHAVMPFNGTRISLVFCRKGCLKVNEESRRAQVLRFLEEVLFVTGVAKRTETLAHPTAEQPPSTSAHKSAGDWM